MEAESFYTAVKALDIPGVKILAVDGIPRMHPEEPVPPGVFLCGAIAFAEKLQRRLICETLISEELLEDGSVLGPMVDMIRQTIEDEVALKSA